MLNTRGGYIKFHGEAYNKNSSRIKKFLHMYADCHGWKYVNIDMILLLVVSFSINLESYVLMTCGLRKFDNFS